MPSGRQDDVVGRLLQRFQQSVKSCVGNLVSFVENVNLKTVTRWTIARGLPEFADLVDSAIGGCVDLDHVDRISGANFGAGFAHAARLRHGLVG